MSRPIGSLCCDYTVTLLKVVKSDKITGKQVIDHSLVDLFLCDKCGTVSKECLL